MIRIFACLLSFHILLGSFLPSMECWEELSRLPQLMAHFEKHKQESKGQISFWTFMQMHYATASQHAQNAPDSEKHQHETLPSLSGHSLHSYVITDFHFLTFSEPLVTEFQEKNTFWWNNLYSFQHQSSLLNPPNFG